MKQYNNTGTFPVPEKEVKEKKRVYKNKLSPWQMESLTAICDTLLPTVAVDSSYDNSTSQFFQASPSMTGTPDLIGGLISERLKHPKVWLMKIALWLLSTSLGTFVICGKLSLATQFPYIQKFSKLPHERREKILQSFQLSYFTLLRCFFKSMKFLTCLVFFTQVDEQEKNVTWKAIGYCGPDPDVKTEPRVEATRNGEDEDEHREDLEKQKQHGPLYKGLVNLKRPRNIVADTLRETGFPVTVHRQTERKGTSVSRPSMTIQCDAVVIGSGSGGGVVAGVLAKAGHKVLVLEKGNYYARENLSLLEGTSMDQMYLSGCLLSTDDMNAVILAGSTVGGGSTVNWSASIQTPQHVLNEWSKDHELELFDSKMYQQAQDMICKAMGVQSQVDEHGFNNAVLRKGCEKLGYPVTNVPQNTPPDHYCGWCCLGCRDGKKQGTAETWLVDVVHSGNGLILPGCEAVKVMHKRGNDDERNTATGVAFSYESNGVQQICVVESKVTVVACGAMCTPLLLKQSGLQNPNIGKNLHLHPVTMAWGYFPEDPEGHLAGKKSYEGGILTSMSTVVANFEESGYGAVIQTPSLHPGMFSALMPWASGQDIKARMCRFSRTAHVFALARDKGSGTVASSSSISYKLDRKDKENLTDGLEKVLRLLAAAGAEEIGTHHCKGRSINVNNATPHEFERFVKVESERALKDSPVPVASAHQMGTCRMGVDPRVSVVDPRGEAWEVDKLYVADTSVFPTAVGVNPMVTVQAIAYCTSQAILESLQAPPGNK